MKREKCDLCGQWRVPYHTENVCRERDVESVTVHICRKCELKDFAGCSVCGLRQSRNFGVIANGLFVCTHCYYDTQNGFKEKCELCGTTVPAGLLAEKKFNVAYRNIEGRLIALDTLGKRVCEKCKHAKVSEY